MLSIIIPALNEEKYLPATLDSILSQNFKNYEIIVCDGESEDKTQEIVKNYGCKLVISKKRNISYQRNLGAKNAKNNLLLFLDADTRIPSNFLKKSIDEFKNKNLDMAGFYIIFDSEKLAYKFYSLLYNSICSLAQYIKPLSLGSGMLVKKSFHEKVNGFDETIFIGEDHEYAQSIAKIRKFRNIKSKKIIYSVRRFEKEGKLKTFSKWIYGGIYVIVKGPIRKKIVNYDFGKF